MKARIKATGQIIEVEPYGDEFARLLPEGDYKVYTKQELEFQHEIDWQQVRIKAAIAAMQGMITNPQTFEQLANDKGYEKIRGGDKSQIIAIASVMYADALIAELKKESKTMTNFELLKSLLYGSGFTDKQIEEALKKTKEIFEKKGLIKKKENDEND